MSVDVEKEAQDSTFRKVVLIELNLLSLELFDSADTNQGISQDPLPHFQEFQFQFIYDSPLRCNVSFSSRSHLQITKEFIAVIHKAHCFPTFTSLWIFSLNKVQQLGCQGVPLACFEFSLDETAKHLRPQRPLCKWRPLPLFGSLWLTFHFHHPLPKGSAVGAAG